MVFLFYSIFTGIIILLALFSFGANKDTLILGLLMLPFLGLFQLINALYNAFRGSRMQLFYFFGSLLFLVFYIAVIVNDMAGIRRFLDIGEDMFLLLPLGMALLYCCILYIDHPDRYRTRREEATEPLDGGLFWEKTRKE